MMFVFSAIGIPVFSLIFSLIHPQPIQAKSFSTPQHVIPKTISVPAKPTIQAYTFIHKTNSPTLSSFVLNKTQSSPAPSSRPTDTQTLSPTSTSTPTATPATTQQPTDDKQAFIIDAINAYRASQGLGPVQINDVTCNFANTRAQEITTNFSHDGFNQRIQNHTLPYPTYALVTENIAETSNYQEVVTMWANSPGHAANMRADTPYVCVESSGNYYAYEGWKPQ